MFAPGIKEKGKIDPISNQFDPSFTNFVIQHHQADRVGSHFDFRIQDPLKKDIAHSWATRKWPKPGEKVLVKRQSTHDVPYMDFQGRIESGYGKGDVKIVHRDEIELINSSPGKIRFNVYKGRDIEEYALIQTNMDKDPNNWLLNNITKTKSGRVDYKGKYKEKKPDQVDLKKEDYIIQPKIDGASCLIDLEANKRPLISSYREGKVSKTGLIDHTWKMPDIANQKVPSSLRDTVVRAEVFARDNKTGKALDPAEIGGMLNSTVLNSRRLQDQKGKLVPVLFDCLKYKGKDYSDKPYPEKLKVLQEVAKEIKGIEVPETAFDEKHKQRLFDKIKSGKYKDTKEGVVVWPVSGTPIKVKNRIEEDVFIKDFFPAQGKYKDNAVGGIEYSWSKNGPVAGKVGTGFSDKLRKAMFATPELFKGMVMKINAARKAKSGALIAPSINKESPFHLDQNDPDKLDYVHKIIGR